MSQHGRITIDWQQQLLEVRWPTGMTKPRILCVGADGHGPEDVTPEIEVPSDLPDTQYVSLGRFMRQADSAIHRQELAEEALAELEASTYWPKSYDTIDRQTVDAETTSVRPHKQTRKSTGRRNKDLHLRESPSQSLQLRTKQKHHKVRSNMAAVNDTSEKGTKASKTSVNVSKPYVSLQDI